MGRTETQKEGIFADYAAKNKVVRQLIDLALLQNGMLKGEALNNFVKRSIDLINKPFKFAFNICKGIVILRSRNTLSYSFHQLGCDFFVEYGILETIVYIWGNEHLSYSE